MPHLYESIRSLDKKLNDNILVYEQREGEFSRCRYRLLFQR